MSYKSPIERNCNLRRMQTARLQDEPRFLHTDDEDSDQNARMRRLI